MTNCRAMLLCLAVLGGGCSDKVTMVDDVDLELNFDPLTGPSDALHTPYVLGSAMTIYVQTTDKDEHMVDWSVVSSNPIVFNISDQLHDTQGKIFSFTGRALGEGTAQIQVLDGRGHLKHSRQIDVHVPDRIALMAHGLLLIDQPERVAEVTELRIVQGGTATYLTRYFWNSQMLSGNGALSVMPTTGLSGHVENSFLFEDRDWLQVTPDSTATGTIMLPLMVGGVHAADVPVVVVPATDVVDVALKGQNESKAHNGQWLVVLAEALDNVGNMIYGVEYKWDVDGNKQSGLGDIYRYEYKKGDTHLLTATLSDMKASAMIHADKGFVDSSNFVGCSYGGGERNRSLFGLMFLGAALLVLRRSLRRRV